MKTPILVFFFFVSIIISWLIFGGIYYGLNRAITGKDNEHHENCISFETDYAFSNAFLFSLELQSTIGFGGRHPKDRKECWPIILFQCIQPMWALILEGILIVIVITRLTDARYAKFRHFINKCCIYKRDGKLILVIRMIDNRVQTDLCGISVSCKLLKTRDTFEGIRLDLKEEEIKEGHFSMPLVLVLPGLTKPSRSPR